MHDDFRDVTKAVAELPRPAAAQIRQRGERQRTRTRALAVVAAVAVAVPGVALVASQQSDPEGREVVTAPTPTATPSAAWLPAPWTVRSEQSRTWDDAGQAPFRFCGYPLILHGAVTISEQRLAHPDGRWARLVELTPAQEDPMQLFKLSYASCLVPGRAPSIAGPRNVWTYADAASAAEVSGAALHVAELTGGGSAGSLLDSWKS